jgi:hypothetical protein
MNGIYLLQLDDNLPLEDTTETEDPLISLNAITGLASADTMQLAVSVGDQLLGALVDSGSTHSFISVVAASRLHLDPLPLWLTARSARQGAQRRSRRHRQRLSQDYLRECIGTPKIMSLCDNLAYHQNSGSHESLVLYV